MKQLCAHQLHVICATNHIRFIKLGQAPQKCVRFAKLLIFGYNLSFKRILTFCQTQTSHCNISTDTNCQSNVVNNVKIVSNKLKNVSTTHTHFGGEDETRIETDLC